MGRLGVQHAVTLLRDGTPPPEEVLTKVEIIDLENLARLDAVTEQVVDQLGVHRRCHGERDDLAVGRNEAILRGGRRPGDHVAGLRVLNQIVEKELRRFL